MGINYLDCFSGIGGFALGAYNAGFRCENHFFSEIEPFCIELYKKRFPGSIPLGSIVEIDYTKLKEQYEGEWIITGGFPCQPHSIAGKKKGSEDERDLWGECVRALRELRPRFAFFENVPNLFNSDERRFFNRVLSDISALGYDCEWGVIPASSIGAPHKRERIWIIAYIDKKNGIKPMEKRGISIAEWGKEIGCKSWFNVELVTKQMAPSEWKQKGEYNTRPLLLRNDNGLPNGLDRIEGLGNAIVPQIAEILFRLILPYLES